MISVRKTLFRRWSNLEPRGPPHWNVLLFTKRRDANVDNCGESSSGLKLTPLSTTLPFSRICFTTSSSLLVPNSLSRDPLEAVSKIPWFPCLGVTSVSKCVLSNSTTLLTTRMHSLERRELPRTCDQLVDVERYQEPWSIFLSFLFASTSVHGDELTRQSQTPSIR